MYLWPISGAFHRLVSIDFPHQPLWVLDSGLSLLMPGIIYLFPWSLLPDSPVMFGTQGSFFRSFRYVIFQLLSSRWQVLVPWCPVTTPCCPSSVDVSIWWWCLILCVGFSLSLPSPHWRSFKHLLFKVQVGGTSVWHFCASCIAAEVAMFFRQETQSLGQPVLANGEISKVILSGIDLCSEYQSYISPTFLTTPLGWLKAASAWQVQNQTGHLLHLQPSPGSQCQKMAFLCFQGRNAGVLLTPPSPFIMNFTCWLFLQDTCYSPSPSHYHHPFQTTMISWLSCSCGLPAGLPALHPWVLSTSLTLEWAFKNTNHYITFQWLPLSSRIKYTNLALAYRHLYRSDPCKSLQPQLSSFYMILAFFCLFKCTVCFLPQRLCTCCLPTFAWNAHTLFNFTQATPLHPSGLSLNGTFSRKASWPSKMSSHSILYFFIVFMKMLIISVIIKCVSHPPSLQFPNRKLSEGRDYTRCYTSLYACHHEEDRSKLNTR